MDEIRPVFHLSNSDKRMINKIDKLLKDIEVKEKSKLDSLKIKSKVRSIQSSLSIEANSLSIDDVTSIMNDKPVLGKKEEIQEVKNIIEVYKNINNYDWHKEKDFISAHTLLMKYFNDDEGKYRTHGEAVSRGGDIIFRAPESQLVESLMTSLFEYINASEETIHPLVLAAIFHYYVVYIHPFTDGNGRMARFWMSLILKDYNSDFEYIPFEEEILFNQNDYYQAIEECHNNGNVNKFISFILRMILNCIEKINIHNNLVLNKNQKKIIDLIKKDQYITEKEMAKELNVSISCIKYNISKINDVLIKHIGPTNGGYWINIE